MLQRLCTLALFVSIVVTTVNSQLRRVRYRPLTAFSASKLNPVTYRKVTHESSECALILKRTYTLLPAPGTDFSTVPQFGGFYDLVQDSSRRQQKLRQSKGREFGGREFRFEDIFPKSSRFDHIASQIRYINHFSPSRHSRLKRQAAAPKRQSQEVCIKYSDINEAFSIVSRNNKGCQLSTNKLVHPELNDIASSAECILRVSGLISKKFKLSYDEITQALPLIDVRKTGIYNKCPSVIKPAPCTAEKYREVDGRCNNLVHSTWGVSKTPFVRLIPPRYGNGIDTLRLSIVDHGELPLVREISTACHEDVQQSSHELSQMFMAYGQILDHDITFSAPTLIKKLDFDCCKKDHPNCNTIKIPKNDYFHGPSGRRCMDFKRSLASIRPACSLGPREQINAATSIIDASFVYGSDIKMMKSLREFHNGLMKVALPDTFKSKRYKPLLPPRLTLPDKGCIGRSKHDGLYCFHAGDGRINENVFLVSLHIIMLREHNKIARILSQYNQDWDDEKLYQETRRIVAAIIQHITYNEYLPATLGPELMKKYDLELSPDFWNGYDESTNIGMFTSFMSSAFRFSHSNIDNKIDRYNKRHQRTSSQNLREFFRQPFTMYEPGAVDEFFLGMVNQPSQKTDPFMGEEVTNHLFQKPLKTFGIDLSATNIKRGREHGLPGYNEFRKVCKLPVARNFQELGSILQNKTAFIFSKLYKHVDDIDLWSAGIAENNLPGAMVGQTFGCIIGLQFKNTRKGDRFWYENPNWPSSFNYEQLREIKKITMAKLICDNGDDIDTIQRFTMYMPDRIRNPRVKCSEIPSMDFSHWQDQNSFNSLRNIF